LKLDPYGLRQKRSQKIYSFGQYMTYGDILRDN